MKAVVIGQSGQLAQNLARLSGQCLASGRVPELTCLGRGHCDLLQPETVARVIAEASADLVINAAAYTAVDKAESEQAACTALNRTGVAALAQACARKGVPLIHVSTDMVFDGHKSGDYVETDPVAPLSHYGRTKADGEAAVRAALVDHLIVRVSWVYSPFGENFLTAMMRLASTRDALSVVSDQIGHPTYGPDLAVSLLTMGEALLAGRGQAGTYHVAGDETAISRYQQAAETLRLAAELEVPLKAALSPVLTRDFPTPAVRPLNAALNSQKAKDVFGVRVRGWSEMAQTAVRGLVAEQRSEQA